MASDDHRIRERAHALWVEAGQPEGRSDEFWIAAERELAGEGSASDAGRDEALAETFPASDPPAHSGITGPEVSTETPPTAPDRVPAAASTRTTGNDTAAADPGGTKPAPAAASARPQTVRSGDRNTASSRRQ